MHPMPMSREWALQLLASETVSNDSSEPTVAEALLVFEKLRRQLCAPVGVDGFRALAARALAQAKSVSPRLIPVQVTADGRLHGLGEARSQIEPGQDGELGVVLISHLLELFLTFLGTATTRKLVEDVYPLLQAPSQPDTTTSFEIISREIDQLRGVSERLELLADTNPEVQDGLESISANVRDIATILNVFVVVKSRPDGALMELADDNSRLDGTFVELPDDQGSGYLN